MKRAGALPMLSMLAVLGCTVAPADLLQRPGSQTFQTSLSVDRAKRQLLAAWTQHSSSAVAADLPGGAVLVYLANPDRGTDIAVRLDPAGQGARVTYNMKISRAMAPAWIEQPVLDLRRP